MTKVLLVEDDPSILRTLADNLKFEKHDVFTAMDAETAYRIQRSQHPDLILLDLMLPGMSGLELCRKIRTDGAHVPILILTARTEEADRVLGLDLGADDYVTKPFSIPELMARIRALLRRTASVAEARDTLKFGRVEIDFKGYTARLRGKSVEMTRKEFDILRLLVSREGTVVSRDELLSAVWGYDAYPVTRTVDNHIAGLRAKLEEDPSRPVYIQTVHGVGYKFVHDENS